MDYEVKRCALYANTIHFIRWYMYFESSILIEFVYVVVALHIVFMPVLCCIAAERISSRKRNKILRSFHRLFRRLRLFFVVFTGISNKITVYQANIKISFNVSIRYLQQNQWNWIYFAFCREILIEKTVFMSNKFNLS